MFGMKLEGPSEAPQHRGSFKVNRNRKGEVVHTGPSRYMPHHGKNVAYTARIDASGARIGIDRHRVEA